MSGDDDAPPPQKRSPAPDVPPPNVPAPAVATSDTAAPKALDAAAALDALDALNAKVGATGPAPKTSTDAAPMIIASEGSGDAAIDAALDAAAAVDEPMGVVEERTVPERIEDLRGATDFVKESIEVGGITLNVALKKANILLTSAADLMETLEGDERKAVLDAFFALEREVEAAQATLTKTATPPRPEEPPPPAEQPVEEYEPETVAPAPRGKSGRHWLMVGFLVVLGLARVGLFFWESNQTKAPTGPQSPVSGITTVHASGTDPGKGHNGPWIANVDLVANKGGLRAIAMAAGATGAKLHYSFALYANGKLLHEGQHSSQGSGQHVFEATKLTPGTQYRVTVHVTDGKSRSPAVSTPDLPFNPGSL